MSREDCVVPLAVGVPLLSVPVLLRERPGP